MSIRLKSTVLLILCVLSVQGIAHRGGYDSYGGHIGKDCSYHCSKKYREKCQQAKQNLPDAIQVRITECKKTTEPHPDSNKESVLELDNKSVTTASPEKALPKYQAKSYKFWSDFDGDCKDTRAEILRDSSLDPVTWTDESQCKVKTGRWICPYSGREYTYARDIHIDHVVSRGEAHVSGAAYWSKEKKEQFANDKDNLLAVAGSANMEKAHKDPTRWLPDVEEYICAYIKRWVYVKEKWNLTMDKKEAKVVAEIQKSCLNS